MKKKVTNKELFKMLMPYLKIGMANINCKMDGKYKRDDYWTGDGKNITVIITDLGGVRMVEAYTLLDSGSYSSASLTYQQGLDGYGFMKQLRNREAHGYYADVDENGKVIRSEDD